MLKGKMKAEVLNNPSEGTHTQWIGSAAYYNVYINIINGVPITYLTMYKNVVYEYDGSTGVTTEIPQHFNDESVTYAGVDIRNDSELYTLKRFVGNTVTWVEPLVEVSEAPMV